MRAPTICWRVSGCADRADAYPGSMSGGEQRRVAIARALINSPPLLLADEPTSDLDEDTETDIIDLLEQLQRTESFGFVLVTHNLELAKRARRTYEMRQGVLAATDLPRIAVDPERATALRTSQGRRAGGPRAARGRGAFRPSAWAPACGAASRSSCWREPSSSAASCWPISGSTNIKRCGFGSARHGSPRLQHLALNSLRGDVQSVTDLGDGRYELTTYLQNVGGSPIYVMSPDLRAYVQVRTVWQEVPMKPIEDAASGVLKIEGKQTYRYLFDARVRDLHAAACPTTCMSAFPARCWSVRAARRSDDVFERKDNYYVYLKPFDIADEVVLKRMRFSGKPPVWIPMPPH